MNLLFVLYVSFFAVILFGLCMHNVIRCSNSKSQQTGNDRNKFIKHSESERMCSTVIRNREK